MIHQIDFGKNTDCASTQWIHLPGKFERLGVHNVNIGRGYSKNDAIGFGDIFGYEVASLFLNIRGLITNGNLEDKSANEEIIIVKDEADFRQTREIDEGEIQDMGRKNFKVDGLSIDSFICASNSCRVVFNFSFHISEIPISSVRSMVELCPLGMPHRVG